MNLLVLDKNLVAIHPLDTYISFIWTDRFQECGDFELYTAMSKDILEYIRQDNYLWCQESEHLMIIEKITITSDSEDGDRLTVTGRSLESLLDRRVVWGLKSLNGDLQTEIKSLLDENIINPSKAERKIPNFIFKESTDPVITSLKIETQYTGDNIYDVITAICVERGIGFKITLNEQNKFVFEFYAGTDRSYDQVINPCVIFSSNFDNIVDSSYIEEKSSLKNVTLVGGEGEGAARRYTAVGNISGLDRREVFTDARDISSDSDEDITSLFSFNEYPSQVFDNATKKFVTDSNFNSSTADVSSYAGRTVSLTIPKYNNAAGEAVNYATVLLDASLKYVSTVKVWEKNKEVETSSNNTETNSDGTDTNAEESKASGSLETYEFLLPENVKYIYSSMFSQTAINNDVYYGSADDFEAKTIKLSNAEYIAQLRQRGKETLSENTETITFDGQAETTKMFRYGEHFTIGDIVQVSDQYGHDTRARVLEIIISEDESGSAMYPTFSTIESAYLPSGYLKLLYIESNGTQYINTNIKPANQTRIIFTFEPIGTGSNQCYFGSKASGPGPTDQYACVLTSDGTIRIDYGPENLATPVKPSGVTTISKNGSMTVINDQTFANTSAIFTGANNLYLFGGNFGGVFSYPASIRLYSCQIYDGTGLIRDYIPCKNETDQVGLYDLVDGVFYPNAGTGAFVAG